MSFGTIPFELSLTFGIIKCLTHLKSHHWISFSLATFWIMVWEQFSHTKWWVRETNCLNFTDTQSNWILLFPAGERGARARDEACSWLHLWTLFWVSHWLQATVRSPAIKSSQIKHWSLFLSSCENSVKFRNTSADACADHLSQLPLAEEHAEAKGELQLVLLAELLAE